jgi:hypothetical protein
MDGRGHSPQPAGTVQAMHACMSLLLLATNYKLVWWHMGRRGLVARRGRMSSMLFAADLTYVVLSRFPLDDRRHSSDIPVLLHLAPSNSQTIAPIHQ